MRISWMVVGLFVLLVINVAISHSGREDREQIEETVPMIVQASQLKKMMPIPQSGEMMAVTQEPETGSLTIAFNVNDLIIE